MECGEKGWHFFPPSFACLFSPVLLQKTPGTGQHSWEPQTAQQRKRRCRRSREYWQTELSLCRLNQRQRRHLHTCRQDQGISLCQIQCACRSEDALTCNARNGGVIWLFQRNPVCYLDIFRFEVIHHLLGEGLQVWSDQCHSPCSKCPDSLDQCICARDDPGHRSGIDQLLSDSCCHTVVLSRSLGHDSDKAPID